MCVCVCPFSWQWWSLLWTVMMAGRQRQRSFARSDANQWRPLPSVSPKRNTHTHENIIPYVQLQTLARVPLWPRRLWLPPCENIIAFPVMYRSSWLLYKALHILKAQYLIFNLYFSFLLASFDNVIADLALFNVHFYPISSCLPSQEIKLSSCVSFINVKIISLLFIKFQVAADETIARGDANSVVIFLTLQLDSALLIQTMHWRPFSTKIIHAFEQAKSITYINCISSS